MIIEFIKSEKFYLPIIYIAVGVLLYLIITKTVTSIGKIDIKHSKGIDKRKNTIIVLIKNIIKYVIAIIVIILILDVYGVNTTSLIASLGVVTLIVGLAFQDIIKDFLAGVFLIFDNAYAVGDWVEINGFYGEVISLGLKTTKLKAYTGEIKILSNSSFTEVINYSIKDSRMLIDVPISYSVDIEKVENVLKQVKDLIQKEKGVRNLELLGIEEFADSSIKYRVVIESEPQVRFDVKRITLKNIKLLFDKEGIEIPYNQLDVHIEK